MPIVAHIHFESFFSAAFSWHTGFVEAYASLDMTIYYFSLCHGMSFFPLETVYSAWLYASEKPRHPFHQSSYFFTLFLLSLYQ